MCALTAYTFVYIYIYVFIQGYVILFLLCEFQASPPTNSFAHSPLCSETANRRRKCVAGTRKVLRDVNMYFSVASHFFLCVCWRGGGRGIGIIS